MLRVPLRDDRQDATLSKLLAMRIGVVGAVGKDSLGVANRMARSDRVAQAASMLLYVPVPRGSVSSWGSERVSLDELMVDG